MSNSPVFLEKKFYETSGVFNNFSGCAKFSHVFLEIKCSSSGVSPNIRGCVEFSLVFGRTKFNESSGDKIHTYLYNESFGVSTNIVPSAKFSV